mmetsp:Transcript_18523/g.41965  ORF Transcript_18523/g.41965 Transcript_18523/m.41965 type:complete len:255 (-) Transcript_18523:559-1323(-)
MFGLLTSSSPTSLTVHPGRTPWLKASPSTVATLSGMPSAKVIWGALPEKTNAFDPTSDGAVKVKSSFWPFGASFRRAIACLSRFMTLSYGIGGSETFSSPMASTVQSTSKPSSAALPVTLVSRRGVTSGAKRTPSGLSVKSTVSRRPSFEKVSDNVGVLAFIEARSGLTPSLKTEKTAARDSDGPETSLSRIFLTVQPAWTPRDAAGSATSVTVSGTVSPNVRPMGLSLKTTVLSAPPELKTTLSCGCSGILGR